MLIYYVSWHVDSDLSKGKGRATRTDSRYDVTILCRDSNDAMFAFQWLFDHKFTDVRNKKFDITDGVIQMKRLKVDSRGFNAHYIFMDKMTYPLSLSDFGDSLIKYAMRFRN